MGRPKAAKHCHLRPWLSARPDCSEGRFQMVGGSLLMCDPFKRLTSGAKICYLAMSNESAGKVEFSFPLHVARKYGIPSTSLRRYIEELAEAGFIEVVERNANARTANIYRFVFGWKLKPP